MVAATHPINFTGKKFPETIIPDHNVQPKMKSQADFLRKSAVFFTSLYIYHDEVRIYELMEEFTEKNGHCTYGII